MSGKYYRYGEFPVKINCLLFLWTGCLGFFFFSGESCNSSMFSSDLCWFSFKSNPSIRIKSMSSILSSKKFLWGFSAEKKCSLCSDLCLLSWSMSPKMFLFFSGVSPSSSMSSMSSIPSSSFYFLPSSSLLLLNCIIVSCSKYRGTLGTLEGEEVFFLIGDAPISFSSGFSLSIRFISSTSCCSQR